jgi:hypothetical protein
MPSFYNKIRAIKFNTSSDNAIEVAPSSSATPNFIIDASGKLSWSSGSATADTTLYRDSANVLKTDDSFDIASGKTYKIDGANILSATSLGSSVVNSSLTSVGSLTGLTAATPNFTGPAKVDGKDIVTTNLSSFSPLSTAISSEYIAVFTNDGEVKKVSIANAALVGPTGPTGGV